MNFAARTLRYAAWRRQYCRLASAFDRMYSSVIHRFVLHNHDLRKASEAVFSARQIGFLPGWGVFNRQVDCHVAEHKKYPVAGGKVRK